MKTIILNKIPDYHPITILNTLFKKIFLPKTLKHYEKIWKPYGIIINENLLKFHNNDIRKKIRKKLVY
jgi:Fe-S cluster biosynthesis and repair protein YggX